MSLFLSIYHCIYLQEVQSKEIALLLVNGIKAYLPSKTTDVIAMFINGGKGSTVPPKVSRLYTTFLSPKFQTDDFKNMWSCAANLIACLLATAEMSSNLHIHMNSPNELIGTYISGSTTKGIVGKGKTYQTAMMLSESGFCRNQQSFIHMTRGTTSLPCLYFLQWANYVCLCVYLLGINSMSDESPFCGEFFPNVTSAQNSCLESMERIWKLMLDNLNITTEQRTLLINLCIGHFIEKLLNDLSTCRFKVFLKEGDLNAYETFVNEEIFIPSWNTMLDLTEQYEQRIPIGTINYQIMQIDRKYPVFPDEQSLLLFVMTSTNFHDKYGPYYVLYQYILLKPMLDSIAQIIPDILDFYHWVHKEFSDCLTRLEAETLTVHQLLGIDGDCQYVGKSGDVQLDRCNQFTRLCDLISKFQEIYDINQHEVHCPNKSTRVIEIISISSAAGSLLTWLERLIMSYHNVFLSDIAQSEYGKNNYFLLENMKECNEIQINDVSVHSSKHFSKRSDDLTEILPLLNNCCCLSCKCYTNQWETDPSLLRNVVPQVYHLSRLQDDITLQILSKLRRIKQPSTAAVTFSFKNIQESATSIFIESSAIQRLDDLEKNIPPDYKREPSTDYIRQAMKHCHSLSYSSLLDITVGLRIAVDFVIQVYNNKNLNRELKETVKMTKLAKFLKKHILKEETAAGSNVFKRLLGIDSTRLNQQQYDFLNELLMKDIMIALQTFVTWLQDGIYDFSSFPLALKDDLNSEHNEALQRIHKEAIAKDELPQLLDKIQIVTRSLSVCEKTVRELDDPASSNNKTLIYYVFDYIKNTAFNVKDFEMFPSVPTSQYVRYRLALRKLHSKISKELQVDNPGSIFGLKLEWNETISESQLLTNMNLSLTKASDESPYSTKDLCEMSCHDIAEFIQQNRLGKEYAENVIENEVNGKLIFDMQNHHKHLRMILGMKPVELFQFKTTIMRAHNKQPVSKLAEEYTTQKVTELCDQHDCLKKAIPFVVKHNIDGEMLLEADVDVLKQITSDHEAAKDIIKKVLG